MESFGLNNGRPAGEIVVVVDDSGAVTSAKNVITNTEYVGGDFSIAEVTFIINNVSVTDYSMNTAIKWPDPERNSMYSYYPQLSSSNTFDILLYKGSCIICDIFAANGVTTDYVWDHSSESINSISGNAEYDSESGCLIINGDCIINIDVVED